MCPQLTTELLAALHQHVCRYVLHTPHHELESIILVISSIVIVTPLCPDFGKQDLHESSSS